MRGDDAAAGPCWAHRFCSECVYAWVSRADGLKPYLWCLFMIPSDSQTADPLALPEAHPRSDMCPQLSHRPGPFPVTLALRSAPVLKTHIALCSTLRPAVAVVSPSSITQGPFYLSFSAQHGSTPLHDAAIIGQVEVAKLLLEEGAAVEAKDNVRQLSQGLLPQIHACVFGCACVRLSCHLRVAAVNAPHVGGR